jgi:hypothetical protein
MKGTLLEILYELIMFESLGTIDVLSEYNNDIIFLFLKASHYLHIASQ